VTDRDDPPAALPERADLAVTLDDLDDRVASIESTLTDVTARQTAVESYLDQVEHVNESVERRADAALAAVDRLESADNDQTPARAKSANATAARAPPDGTSDATGSRRGADTHIADAAGRPSIPDHHNGPRDGDAGHGVTEPTSGPGPSQSDGPVARLLAGLLGR